MKKETNGKNKKTWTKPDLVVMAMQNSICLGGPSSCTGGGTTSPSDNGDGTWNVAHNRLGTPFTGTLDLTFNISFNHTVRNLIRS